MPNCRAAHPLFYHVVSHEIRHAHKKIRLMYTNADQLPNKMEELKCFIDGREPDIIVITEVIPKAQRQEVPRVRLKLHDYT